MQNVDRRTARKNGARLNDFPTEIVVLAKQLMQPSIDDLLSKLCSLLNSRFDFPQPVVQQSDFDPLELQPFLERLFQQRQ